MLKKIAVGTLEFVGRYTIDMVKAIGLMGEFVGDTMKWLSRKPLRMGAAVDQMVEVGANSFPVVFFTAMFTGMVLALQSHTGFKRFGAESMVGTVVGLSMTRELGPVLTALVVTGRAGSAMTAQLGTMRVTEQIDALYTLAANPIKYLVVPRVIAGTLMLPVLTVMADFVGILGGFVVAVMLLGANPVLYMEKTFEFMEYNDMFSGLLKSMVFGFIISVVGCYQGFYTEGGAEGVGTATTKSVVMGFMLIFLANYILTALLFSNGGGGAKF
ncbi:MAG: ABC transporter permease [Nitrospinae bacterium]|nr:ABC transporter permease [Nitrospinota bacterium]